MHRRGRTKIREEENRRNGVRREGDVEPGIG